MYYMMTVDKEIDLSAFAKDLVDRFPGYKVMLRNVETAELKPVYYDEDFRYVIGENKLAESVDFSSGKIHGICVFATLEAAQEWGQEMLGCWRDDMWQPVVVEVVTSINDVIHTGVDQGSSMAVVKKVFVKRLVEHLRRT